MDGVRRGAPSGCSLPRGRRYRIFPACFSPPSHRPSPRRHRRVRGAGSRGRSCRRRALQRRVQARRRSSGEPVDAEKRAVFPRTLPNFVASTTSSRRPRIGAADEALVGERTIDVGSIEEIDPSSSARSMVATDSASSRSTVELDIPMQPRPMPRPSVLRSRAVACSWSSCDSSRSSTSDAARSVSNGHAVCPRFTYLRDD